MRLALVLSFGLVACVEPGQPQPHTPIEGGPCPSRPVDAPVGGRSPRDDPEYDKNEGYGYEFEIDPLCAGGGILGIEPTPAPPPQKDVPPPEP